MKALIFIFLAGCSFLVSRPPDPPRIGSPPCHVSQAPAIFDTVEAVSGGVLGLWALTTDGDGENMGAMGGAIRLFGALALAQSAIYGASAYYGFSNVRKCEEQRRDFVIQEVEAIEEEEVEIHRRRTIYMRPRQ